MSNGLKTLLISVAAVVTIAAISFLFLSTRVGKEFVNDTVPRLFQHSDKDTSGIYEVYDGTTIFGTDVIAAVDKYGETITVKITLGDGTVVTDLSKITNASDKFYVNPMGTFRASLEYDSEGSTVVALLFNQVVDKVSKPTAVPAPPSTSVEIQENYELDHIVCTNPTMYTLEGADDFNRYGLSLKAYFLSNSGDTKVVDFATSDLIAAGKYHNTVYEKGTYHDNLVSDYDKNTFLVRAGEEDSEYNLMISFTYNGRTAHTRIKIMVTKPVEYNLVSGCGDACGLCLTDGKAYSAYAGHPMDLVTDKIQTGNGVSIAVSVPNENTTVSSDLSIDDHVYRAKTQTNTNATVKYEISRYVTDEYYTFNVSVAKFQCVEQYNVTSEGTITENKHWVASGDEFRLKFNTMCKFNISNYGTDTGAGEDARVIVIKSSGGSDTSTNNCVVTATDKISGFEVKVTNRVWDSLAVVKDIYLFDYKQSTTMATGKNTKKVIYKTNDKDWFTMRTGTAIAAGSEDIMEAKKGKDDTSYSPEDLQLVQEFVNFGDRRLSSKVRMFATLDVSLSMTGEKTYGCSNVWTATQTGGWGELTYEWKFDDTGSSRYKATSGIVDRAVAFVLGEPKTVNAAGNTYTINKLVVGMEDDTLKCTVTDKLGYTKTSSNSYAGIQSSYSLDLTSACTCSGSTLVAGHPFKVTLGYANSGSNGTFSITSDGPALKYGTTSASTKDYTNGVAGITDSFNNKTYYVTTQANTAGISTASTITVKRTDTGESFAKTVKYKQFTAYMFTNDYKNAGSTVDDGTENDKADSDDVDEIKDPKRTSNYVFNTSFRVRLKTNGHGVKATLYDWKTHVDGTDSTVIANVGKMDELTSGTIESPSGEVYYSTASTSFNLGEYYKSSNGACKSETDTVTLSDKYQESIVCTCTKTHKVSNGAYNADYVWGQNNSWQTVPNDTDLSCTLSEGIYTAIFSDNVSNFVLVRRMPAGTQSVNLALRYNSSGGLEYYSYTMRYATGVNHGVDVDKFSTDGGKTVSGRYGWKDAVTALSDNYTDPTVTASGRVRYFTPCDDVSVELIPSTCGNKKHDCGRSDNYKFKNSTHAKIDNTQTGDDKLHNYGLDTDVYRETTNSSNKKVRQTLSRKLTYIRFKVNHAGSSNLTLGDNNHYELRLFNNFGCSEALGTNKFRFDRVKIIFNNYCRPEVYVYTRGADS